MAFTLTLLVAGSSSSRESAPASLQSVSGHAGPLEWLKFDTNACGQLGKVEGRESVLIKRVAGDESDDDDDDNYSWTQVWGMPDEDSLEGELWHSEHPQVAIVSDAVARSCENEGSDFKRIDPDEFV